MKQTITILFFLLCLLMYGGANTLAAENADGLKSGDIVFQELAGGQNLAVRLVTGSRYTHCGIVMERDGELAVYETISNVGWKPLAAWQARGVDGHYVVMRLRDDRALTREALEAMLQSGTALEGKPYDLWFQWSDSHIYCSELVWKMYMRGAGIELSALRPFKTYDNVKHPEVQRLADERYPGVIPWDEEAVAPSDLMQSPLLYVVFAN